MKRREIRPPQFLDPIFEKIFIERGGTAFFNEIKKDVEKLEEEPVADTTISATLKRRIKDGAIKKRGDEYPYELVLKGTPGFLFRWNYIPKNEYDNKRLTKHIAQKFGIEWVKTAKINKSDDGKVIKIYNEKNYLSLELNYEKKEANLKIDSRTVKFIAKIEYGKINIYERSLPFEILRNTAYERTLNHWREDIYSQIIAEERNRKFVMYYTRALQNIRGLFEYVNEKYLQIQDSEDAEDFLNRSLAAIGKLIKRTKILLTPPEGQEYIPPAIINEALIDSSFKKETIKGYGSDLSPSYFVFVEGIIDDRWQDA